MPDTIIHSFVQMVKCLLYFRLSVRFQGKKLKIKKSVSEFEALILNMKEREV